jgi:hypothetical protein
MKFAKLFERAEHQVLGKIARLDDQRWALNVHFMASDERTLARASFIFDASDNGFRSAQVALENLTEDLAFGIADEMRELLEEGAEPA